MKNTLLLALSLSCFLSNAQVILNEVQSSNSVTIADNKGDFDDWIEIHNPTADSLEIGGLILKDRIDTWSIPTDSSATLIPPGGYFLLWADDEEFQGIFHTNFKLASGGEFLGLYESDGITVIDSITLPALESDNSYQKCNGDIWWQTSVTTPLLINDCIVGLIDNITFNDLFSVTVNIDKQLKATIIDYSQNERNLSIHSISGKEIIKQPLTDKETVINLNGLNSTIYIVTISSANSIYSKRIVIP